MRNIFKKSKKAFSLVETLTTLTLIGIIAALTVSSTLGSEKMRLKKIKALSKTFYAEAEYAYSQILNNETRGYNITRMNELQTAEDNSRATEFLSNHFKTYMDLYSSVNCDAIPNNIFASDYTDDMICMSSSRGLEVGLYLDLGCKMEFRTYDYLKEDDSRPTQAQNSCGFIIYAPRRSDGITGRDLFIIGLGKRGFTN